MGTGLSLISLTIKNNNNDTNILYHSSRVACLLRQNGRITIKKTNKMKTQEELGRKQYVMDSIVYNTVMSLEDNLRELEEMPENFINVIYEVSYDEMTGEERRESEEWIESELRLFLPE